MDSFLSGQRGNPGINKGFIVAFIVAVAAVAGLIYFAFSLPTQKEEKQEILENALLEGTPEFDEYTKNIIITNDPRRMREAKTGLGDVVMQLSARISNRGVRDLIGLEVSVGMIDTKNQLIKDKKVLFVPRHHPELKAKETIDVSVSIGGFKSDDDRANARWKVTAIKFSEKQGDE